MKRLGPATTVKSRTGAAGGPVCRMPQDATGKLGHEASGDQAAREGRSAVFAKFAFSAQRGWWLGIRVGRQLSAVLLPAHSRLLPAQGREGHEGRGLWLLDQERDFDR